MILESSMEKITTEQEIPVRVHAKVTTATALMYTQQLVWTSTNKKVFEVVPDTHDGLAAIVRATGAGEATLGVVAALDIDGEKQSVYLSAVVRVAAVDDGYTVELVWGDPCSLTEVKAPQPAPEVPETPPAPEHTGDKGD